MAREEQAQSPPGGDARRGVQGSGLRSYFCEICQVVPMVADVVVNTLAVGFEQVSQFGVEKAGSVFGRPKVADRSHLDIAADG